MPTCPACGAAAAPAQRSCDECGAALDSTSSLTEALRPETPVRSPEQSRFLPGTLLAGRYRIVGLVGRGGMGEVYRADDLRLGQDVALKFLPEGLEHDPDLLERFFAEVRSARQVTHANVCRVHDTVEVDGLHLISMEYIDGEDLASLLRRIGRLPKEKAVQIASQLCAGLAAAHAQGILHRDLKPANVMVDGRGRVRITDFGLAGLAEELGGAPVRAGTPAYMAPEQLAGRPATARSDIFALGLVLYELFTGKRAYAARTPDELRSMQESTPTSPSSLVEGFDPAVERAILRCLEHEPAQRPASALAVLASLPGSDPLAAALAAGETPSPEMVADAEGEGGLSPPLALLLLVAFFAALAPVVFLLARARLPSLVPLPKPPEVLAEEARQILREAGHTAAATDTARGFLLDEDYYAWVLEHDRSPGRWDDLARVRPAPLYFWYRQSPRHLFPWYWWSPVVTDSDPPPLLAGMAGVRLDPDGRLVELTVVPPQRDLSAGPWPDPDWRPLLARAGLDASALEPVEPEWNPLVDCDRRAAWLGSYPEPGNVPIRVEAGSYRGNPVYFSIVAPWTRAGLQDPETTTTGARIATAVGLGVLFALLIGSTLLARRNLRLGRGDRRGAQRVAVFVFATLMLSWVFGGDHVPQLIETGLFLQAIVWSLFLAVASWVFYVALEPYVRKLWPELLVAWSRLVAGRWRDPLVGRAILAGALAALAMRAWQAFAVIGPPWLGWTGKPPDPKLGLAPLDSIQDTLAMIFLNLAEAPWFALGTLCLILLLRVVLRRRWAAVAAFLLLFTAVGALRGPVGLVENLVFWGLWVFVLTRFGLLALAMMLVFEIVGDLPPPTDLDAWYAGRSLAGLALLAGLVVFGFRLALAGRPLVVHDPLEERPD